MSLGISPGLFVFTLQSAAGTFAERWIVGKLDARTLA